MMVPNWYRFGVVQAYSLFRDFSNEKNQGEMFTWVGFPDMVYRMTRHYPLRTFAPNWLIAYIAKVNAYSLAYADINLEKVRGKK